MTSSYSTSFCLLSAENIDVERQYLLRSCGPAGTIKWESVKNFIRIRFETV